MFKVCLLLCVAGYVYCRTVARENNEKRLVHGCPFAFPCPPLACDNPIYDEHDCCGHCPDPEQKEQRRPEAENDPECLNPCRYNNSTFCGHIPCPLPPCDKPLVLTPGDCCAHCPSSILREVDANRWMVTTAGHWCKGIYCTSMPCNVPLVLKPGECCPVCPTSVTTATPLIATTNACDRIYCTNMPCDVPLVLLHPGDCCPGCPPMFQPQISTTTTQLITTTTNPCTDIYCTNMPCDVPLVLIPGDCCPTCPLAIVGKRAAQSSYCPFPCTQDGYHYCFPQPCPPPHCADSVKSKGACCNHCPNGKLICLSTLDKMSSFVPSHDD